MFNISLQKLVPFFAVLILLNSCKDVNPNLDNTGKNELKALEVNHPLKKSDQIFNDIVYVPIYSDLYFDHQNPDVLLAATLSIRNTSYTDSLFVSKIDYYDTGGKLVRQFIDNLISLPPMATVNYVIERDDDTGGPGANFIVEFSAKNEAVKPLIQAIMVGQTGNKAFAFPTNGHSIK